ncbi:MAG: PASTA domain-containing protein [Methylococcaceae bacterium]
MVKIVEITQLSNTVTCDENGKTTIQFNITNISSSSLRVGARIICKEPAQKSWFTLDGSSEKKIDIKATDQFSVSVSAENASAGDYKVSLMVYSVENPDEEYTESGAVTIKIPSSEEPPPPPSGFPKWLIWVLVGIVILSMLGGFGYWIAKQMGDKTDPQPSGIVAIVPDVTGELVASAVTKLEGMDFNSVETESRFDNSSPENTVLEQTPEANTRVDPSKTDVLLIIANSMAEMPDILDKTFDGASNQLKNKGFKLIKKESRFFNGKPPGTVLEQSPEPGVKVSITEPVTLTVASAGIKVPSVVNKSLSSALTILQRSKLNLGDLKIQANTRLKKDIVISQDPAPGKNVKEKTEIKLVVSTKAVKTQLGRPVLFNQFHMNMIKQSGIQVNKKLIRQLAPAE